MIFGSVRQLRLRAVFDHYTAARISEPRAVVYLRERLLLEIFIHLFLRITEVNYGCSVRN
uniref:Uncharacterized protein n=1 Tax=Parascaris univalens TaxID=6257 RepID=A0A915CF99_PARUN